ncbi:DUF302 domain-containing protein [Dehalogenimonas sp. THU2]|uniref:DUF302 domain-containing protein n=1 Tax=Dehalogenimonas sp. THU2 TaxID=3151121 RepID=UPI00321865DF
MYGYKRQVHGTFDAVVQKTREELKKEGFGIMTEIDVRETLKKKLDVDYDNYVILGACNPPFAYKALQAEKEIGLLLPCNVIVYEDGGQVFVSAILATEAMKAVDNENLGGIAVVVEDKLKKVVDSI